MVLAAPRQAAPTLVRWVVSLHVLALLVQIAAAVALTSGWPEAFIVHATVGHLLFLLGICQGIAVMSVRSVRQSPLTASMAGILPLPEALQIYLGHVGLLAWHLTLGLLIWGGALAIWIRVSAIVVGRGENPGTSAVTRN